MKFLFKAMHTMSLILCVAPEVGLSESLLPPCTRFRIVETYQVDPSSLPTGLSIVKIESRLNGTRDDDYLRSDLNQPVILEADGDWLIKLEGTTVSKNRKNRFKGLQGVPGDPVSEPWIKLRGIPQELKLYRLVRGTQKIQHPFPLGSDHKVNELISHDFSLRGIESPRWENAKIVGDHFNITGKVTDQQIEQNCHGKPK